jgi:hypothetical protein
MEYKLEYYPSVQYLQKISAALGKLEIALKYFTKEIYGESKYYDFSIRQNILDESRDLKLVANNYHNRTYKNPEALISNPCASTNEQPEASHGFRWNFAKNRMLDYAKAGYTYNDSLQGVSNEMKHNRASITEHYLGG